MHWAFEAAAEHNATLYRCYLDFGNAFNSNDREALWCWLHRFNIPDIDLLQALYERAYYEADLPHGKCMAGTIWPRRSLCPLAMPASSLVAEKMWAFSDVSPGEDAPFTLDKARADPQVGEALVRIQAHEGLSLVHYPVSG